MRHARSDYNRIQDPAGIIPEDEPVFLIRGQDRAAVATIKAYALFAEREGADPDFVNMVRLWATEMETWQAVNGLRVKVPDLPGHSSFIVQPSSLEKCPECATGTMLPAAVVGHPAGGRVKLPSTCDQCGYSLSD